ncbi:putative transcription factor interactor and regulator CCHC(Zn) family [Helianthus annuus]|nr:putative transcription factor interactor and regulator CCHC(Zn) family [Helianthus annuus]KAJ0607412.1 putative transcription factor interactor and regulator CCHC(Zn) family [Helianthus annuus]KAJ0767468.1 putative transcription factor interactor and regulator CCHC(Zn) family [Helianthus annuus]
MNQSWWGTPAPDSQWDPSAWTITSLAPQSSDTQSSASQSEIDFKIAWMQAIAPPSAAMISANQWASVTNQRQSEPKITTDWFGNQIQVPVKPAPTTDLYENPLPPVGLQHHRSTVEPSSLDPKNSSQTKSALYAEIVKDASNGESSGNDDSSEHDRSSDEDVSTSVEGDTTSSSSSSEDGSKCESSREVINSDAERPTPESDSSQVCDSKPDSISAVVECAKCLEYAEKESLFDITHKHNQELIVDLSKATEANLFLTRNEKEFKETIASLKYDVSELQKAVLRKQHANNNLIDTIEKQMVELATARCECETIKQKLESYSNSRFVLDHIIDVQRKKGDTKCIGYKSCPPPMNHNYSKLPNDEDMPRFEPTVPLGPDDFAAGLGFTTGTSSSGQSESENVTDTSCVKEQSPPIIEDADSSDDESEEIVNQQSDSVTTDIPIENHILCDPPVKPSKTEKSKAMESLVVSPEGNNLLYTLKGDSKIYSDKDFSIKNVNQDLIEQIFEGRTDKFLGNKGSKVTVTQCDPIPCEQVRKQYGNQKLPVERKQQVNSGKGKGQVQGKKAQNKNVQAPEIQQPKTEQPKVQQPKVEQSKATQPKATQPKIQQSKVGQPKVQRVQNKRAPAKKREQKVNFVGSKGTDKLETFQNKSNIDFVKQVRILKRNDQNNYTQHTNGCDLGPSTSRSQSSVSGSPSGHQHVSPRIVERRYCFECGTIGHIIRNCPYLHKLKAKVDDPREQHHAAQENRKGKQGENKKKDRKINFVKSRGTDKIDTFKNKSNKDSVKQSKILKRNSQNNYTQQTNGCDVGPSTSRSRSSSSSCYSYDTPRIVHISPRESQKLMPPMVTITIKDLFHQNRTLVLLNNEKRNRKRNKEKKLKKF